MSGSGAEGDKPSGDLTLRTLAMPADANPAGDIFGGWVLSQMDIAGGICAAKEAQCRVATVGIEAMSFLKPIYVGDVLCVYSSIKKFTNCLELGSGSGVISICLASRINDSKILGVEKNKLLVEIAKRNLVNNDLSRSKINFQHFDIMGKEFSKIY